MKVFISVKKIKIRSTHTQSTRNKNPWQSEVYPYIFTTISSFKVRKSILYCWKNFKSSNLMIISLSLYQQHTEEMRKKITTFNSANSRIPAVLQALESSSTIFFRTMRRSSLWRGSVLVRRGSSSCSLVRFRFTTSAVNTAKNCTNFRPPGDWKTITVGGSVVDPDPCPDSHSGSGFEPWRAKMTHKNRKKFLNFIFWSAGCSLLRAEGFSCS